VTDSLPSFSNDVIQLKALSVILKYHTTGHFLFMILVTKSLSPAIFEMMGIKHRGPWPWSFEVRRRHRSRDHSARYWPFPIGDPFGTKSLSLTVSKMFCLKLHVLIDTMLNRHCACAISRNMYPYAKFNYIISISYPHFVYSLYHFHWAPMKNKGCSLRGPLMVNVKSSENFHSPNIGQILTF